MFFICFVFVSLLLRSHQAGVIPTVDIKTLQTTDCSEISVDKCLKYFPKSADSFSSVSSSCFQSLLKQGFSPCCDISHVPRSKNGVPAISCLVLVCVDCFKVPQFTAVSCAVSMTASCTDGVLFAVENKVHGTKSKQRGVQLSHVKVETCSEKKLSRNTSS